MEAGGRGIYSNEKERQNVMEEKYKKNIKTDSQDETIDCKDIER